MPEVIEFIEGYAKFSEAPVSTQTTVEKVEPAGERCVQPGANRVLFMASKMMRET